MNYAFTNFADSGTSKGTAFATFAGSAWGWRVCGLGLLKWEDGLVLISHVWGNAQQGVTWFETPRVHPTMIKRKPGEIIARANDLIQLGIYGAVCARALTGPHKLHGMPVAWKKQLAKPMHHRKAWFDVLDAAERELIMQSFNPRACHVDSLAQYILNGCETVARKRKVEGYGAQATDLLDAVCMGLHHHGRLVL